MCVCIFAVFVGAFIFVLNLCLCCIFVCILMCVSTCVCLAFVLQLCEYVFVLQLCVHLYLCMHMCLCCICVVFVWIVVCVVCASVFFCAHLFVLHLCCSCVNMCCSCVCICICVCTCVCVAQLLFVIISTVEMLTLQRMHFPLLYLSNTQSNDVDFQPMKQKRHSCKAPKLNNLVNCTVCQNWTWLGSIQCKT